ncbi:MAG TPA: NAD(P)H:quinone oxidoreductase [Mycobacteriales bacterium]|nr:NAD(P)H:quinone oxidoreductase [Mycobacteriales bacterium]
MTDPVRIAVVYYSATGNVHRLAEAIADGAADAGGEVRLRRVAELAPAAVIEANPAWRAHLDATAQIAPAVLADLTWADGLAFGSPTRFGNVSAQLKQFLDTTSELWLAGRLMHKPVTGFVGSMAPHGGQESTLLALYHTMIHWGSVIVPSRIDDELAQAAGANPYGISQVESQAGDLAYVEAVRKTARRQGRRLVETARVLGALRAA